MLMLAALAITATVVFVCNQNGGGIFLLLGASDRKHADALAVALQFFQVQKGTYVVVGANQYATISSPSLYVSPLICSNYNHLVQCNWNACISMIKCSREAGEQPDPMARRDSALDDGKEAKLDLSKGMYNAGDHMKFGFTTAFMGTMLAWSILQYGD